MPLNAEYAHTAARYRPEFKFWTRGLKQRSAQLTLAMLCGVLPVCTAWAQGLKATEKTATAQTATAQIASNRTDRNGQAVQIPMRYDKSGDKPKAVLLVLPSLQKATPSNTPALALFETEHFPVWRNQKALLDAGFDLAWMGWPSESEFGISGVKHPHFFKDITAAIEKTRQQWPATPLILTSTDSSAVVVLSYALKHKSQIDGLLALAPAWTLDRELPVESLQGLRGLVLHDASGECLAVSRVEVAEISARAGFDRLAIVSPVKPVLGRCMSQSAHWMPSLDGQLPALLAAWLDKQPLPAVKNETPFAASFSERVLTTDANAKKLEITVYTPAGPGPFPWVVFNHGDVETDSPYVKDKRRYTDPILARVFLNWGFAIAFPARPGVGRSEGIYQYANYAVHDANPNYKAKQHAEFIEKAMNRLRQEPDLHRDRILLAGQSAGGDAIMYMSTLPIPGVQGVINFSGGRANHYQGESAAFENNMMIEGWRELGYKAKVPAMLVFTENDSRFSANTIRKSASAFTESGAQAELLLLPPISGDGHFVYQFPQLWARQVGLFTQKVGSTHASNTHVAATAATHPELFDLQRMPVQSETCKDIYLRFLNAPLPRFFATGVKGRGCGYSSGATGSAEKALGFCENRVGACRLYAQDDALVPPSPSPAAQAANKPLY